MSLKFDKPVIDRFRDRRVLENLTFIPPNEIKKYRILYVWEIVDYELSTSDMEKMEIFWEYFRNFWLSSPAFICSWHVNHHPPYLTQKMMRTNNGLERYNRTLSDLFDHLSPSLINFIEILELESRDQLDTLNNIRKRTSNQQKKKKRERSPKRKIQQYFYLLWTIQ